MAQTLTATRREAVLKGLQELRQSHSQTKMGSLLGVSQQHISNALRNGNVGIVVADALAEHFGTTLDGLVRRYGKGEGPVRARDVIGWKQAVTDAQQQHPRSVEAWAWHRAGDVVLPVAPDLATAQFAYDIAHLLQKYGEQSGVIERVK